MNPDTGEIRTFRNQSEATAAGFTVNLTDEEVKYLHSIPEAERQAWLLANKHRGVPHVHQSLTREMVMLDDPEGLISTPRRKSTAVAHHTDPARVATSGGKLGDAPRRPASSPPGPGGYVPGSFKSRRRK